jgi:hypothetical protein
VELEGCSSLDGVNDGETIAKDPTAAAWFAISVSRSVAIALPALAAMSDLIADASGTLAPLISEIAAGAAGLSPLQPLASINPAASAIRRYTRSCMMTSLLLENGWTTWREDHAAVAVKGRHGAKAQQYSQLAGA